MGFSYGNLISTANISGHYISRVDDGTSDFSVLDLGVLTVPPFPVPETATRDNLILRHRWYGILGTSGTYSFQQDWIMLLPVSEGMVYGSGSWQAGTGVLMDSRSRVPGVYVVGSSDEIVRSPLEAIQGRPPEAHPDGMRLWMAFGTEFPIDGSHTATLTYVPRWLQVG